MSMVIPPSLSAGDTIGIVCPSGFMSLERVLPCMEVLKAWGFRVKLGKTVGGRSTNYFSGDDSERLKDLQEMLDDEEVKAILFGRGGYGLSRIIGDINFKRFRKSPKWLLGYSDITLLHAHVYANYEIVTGHTPMAGAFADAAPEDPCIKSIRHLLAGKGLSYTADTHPLNQQGEARGVLMGGNLTLLTHTIGGSSDFKTKGLILFIEDIGEYLYNIDRMLYQMKEAGKFNKPAGIIVGSFSDLKDTERPFGKNAYEIIHDVLSEYDYPVCFGFPVGHVKENFALKCGAEVVLKVGRNETILYEV